MEPVGTDTVRLRTWWPSSSVAVLSVAGELDNLEAEAVGGQAGTSSRIENYLGFPDGISGAQLTDRARRQAGKFDAEVLNTREVTGLRLDRVRTALIRRGGYPEDMVVPEPALLDAEPIEAVLAALAELGGAAAFLRDNGATDAELATWRALIVE